MKPYKIAITTGDKLGIGSEITKKALNILKPLKSDVLIIGEKLDIDYDTVEIKEDINGAFCYKSLEYACNLANKGHIKALVTAPVSKFELNKAGYNYSGQTEIIEKFLSPNEKRAQMLFIANNLRVMLLSRHCALKDIKITKESVIYQTKILNEFLYNKCGIKSPKIALCALNPHCGEGGILGMEEIEILNPAVEELKKENINITAPISADALFAKVGQEYLSETPISYDAVIACYHDQGLAPVKALAFRSAINTTIGLKIIRTSPSSGTAYDIAGKNMANPDSMVSAIKLAMELS